MLFKITRLRWSISFMLSNVSSLSILSMLFCPEGSHINAIFRFSFLSPTPMEHSVLASCRMIFHCVSDEVQGERSIDSVRARCAQYLDRAELLKQYLEKIENPPPRKPIKESRSDDKGWDGAYCLACLYLCVFIVRLCLLFLLFVSQYTAGILSFSKEKCSSGAQQLVEKHTFNKWFDVESKGHCMTFKRV